MAGGVLLSIIIIGVVMFAYRGITSLQKEKDVGLSNAQVSKINEQIEKMESKNYDETPKEDFSTMYEKLFGRKPLETPILQEEQQEDTTNTAIDLVKNNMSVFDQSAEYQKPIYKFIGIVFNTYIIIEMDKEMYIIDQHAAHERIMYEKVKKNYYSETSKDSQMLRKPISPERQILPQENLAAVHWKQLRFRSRATRIPFPQQQILRS